MGYTASATSGGKKNNGGTILGAGTVVGTNFRTLSLIDTNIQGKTYGSKVIVQTRTPYLTNNGPQVWVNKAIANGTLAKLAVGNYIGIRLAGTVAGIANSTLLSGAGDFSRPKFNGITSIRSTLQSTAGWNYVTGRFLTTPVTQVDSFGYDKALQASRAVPGRLTYTDHSMAKNSASYLDSYKPKTG